MEKLTLDDIKETELELLKAVDEFFTYTSYSFQLTNRIGKYAFVVIFQRAVYAVFVVVLLCL